MVKGEESMGERLQRLRQAAGLSQPQLAEAAGVPVGTLRNWEQGRRVPLLDTAACVAGALGVSLDELAPPVAPAPAKKGKGRKS
jgi:transcriptional regulator with XRE-family HTH domain